MEINRRHLAAAGALAFGTLNLLQSASSAAEYADEAERLGPLRQLLHRVREQVGEDDVAERRRRRRPDAHAEQERGHHHGYDHGTRDATHGASSCEASGTSHRRDASPTTPLG